MARILTDQPSTGKNVSFARANLASGVWTTLIEAPDFSIPLTSDDVPSEFVDETDPNNPREIVPGEVFLGAPVLVTNKTAGNVSIEFQVISESGTTYAITPQIVVPANDGVRVSLQGQTLSKLQPDTVNGDRLQARASVGAALDIFGSGQESAAAVHARDTESV